MRASGPRISPTIILTTPAPQASNRTRINFNGEHDHNGMGAASLDEAVNLGEWIPQRVFVYLKLGSDRDPVCNVLAEQVRQ